MPLFRDLQGRFFLVPADILDRYEVVARDTDPDRDVPEEPAEDRTGSPRAIRITVVLESHGD